MTLLAGVSLESLEAAIKVAAVQAEQLHIKHPQSDVLDNVRLELAHLYELVHDEVKIWRRAGEKTA
jgi:hypothetical protein